MPNTEPNRSARIPSKLVHVAVAVIRERRCSGEDLILLSKRPEHVHQGGLWEFPGGKVESGEHVLEALDRELQEELGIGISSNPDEQPQALIRIQHDYGDKCVLLDVWELSGFEGSPHGKEGQRMEWLPLSALNALEFPAANLPIVEACMLPKEIAITPEFDSLDAALSYLDALEQNGCELVVFRQKHLALADYMLWSASVQERFSAGAMHVLLHGDPRKLNELSPPGVHMPSDVAKDLGSNTDYDFPLSMSCHDANEVNLAQRLGVRFVTLSPVALTSTHPDQSPMGWDVFRKIADQALIPVYALGGMSRCDLVKARKQGAQGIAGIGFWSDSLRRSGTETSTNISDPTGGVL